MICKKLFGYGIGLTRDIENIRQMKNDYGAAADYAENSMGIGYGILSKESRSLIYCSALVWQSRRYLDRSYDMSAGFQVFPVEIANSMQTKLVAAYSNK